MPDQKKKKYSETLADRSIRQVVLETPDGGCTRLRTAIFRMDTGQGTEWDYWLEAWQNQKTNKWTIARHERIAGETGAMIVSAGVSGEGNVAMTHRTLEADLCFFDALHACAAFESGEKSFNREQVAEETAQDYTGALPYQAAAERALVPRNLQGLPAPAAWGVILVDGEYSPAARKLAEKTADRKLAAEPPTEIARRQRKEISLTVPGEEKGKEPAENPYVADQERR